MSLLLNKNRGITLAEILIASSIFSLVLLAASALLVSGLKLYSFNTQMADNQAANRISMISITRDIRMLDGQDINEIHYNDSDDQIKKLIIGQAIEYRLNIDEKTLYRVIHEGESEDVSILTKGISDMVVHIDIPLNSIKISITQALNNQTQETTISLRD